MPETSVAIPGPHEWKLRNVRTDETRIFSQSELSIEGESRLLGLVKRTAEELNEDGFPWEAIGPLFEPGVDIDWMVASKLLGIIGDRMPDAFTELATILLGIYPTNEDDSKNPTFDSDRRFLKGSIKFALIVDMLKVFIEQNDYQRMADPIGAIIGATARSGMAANTNSTSPDAAKIAGS